MSSLIEYEERSKDFSVEDLDSFLQETGEIHRSEVLNYLETKTRWALKVKKNKNISGGSQLVLSCRHDNCPALIKINGPASRRKCWKLTTKPSEYDTTTLAHSAACNPRAAIQTLPPSAKQVDISRIRPGVVVVVNGGR